MSNERRSWGIGDGDRQRSPNSGEFETVDTERGSKGEFRSPSELILEELSVGEASSVSEVAKRIGSSEATTVEHLNRLEEEGLVETSGRGWSLAQNSANVDPVIEKYRKHKEEAADWEYDEDESQY